MRSSPSTSTRACSWIRPERSTRSRNAILPWPRRAARRPATRNARPVSSPGSSSSQPVSASAAGVTPGKLCGNGSMPCARRRSSLARRAASRSETCSSSLISESDVDLRDLQLARGAARAPGPRRSRRACGPSARGRPATRSRAGSRPGWPRPTRRSCTSTDLPVFSSLTCTSVPTCTLSVGMSFVSMTWAPRRRSSSCAMRDSTIACSFLASSYSEFSAMSPNSRASLMRSATSRRRVGAQGLELLLELLEAFRGEDDVLGHGASYGLEEVRKTPLGAGRTADRNGRQGGQYSDRPGGLRPPAQPARARRSAPAPRSTDAAAWNAS